MSKRGLDWIRRHTTTEDLLDDGVENFSDLKTLESRSSEEPEPSPESLAVRRQTLERRRKEQQQFASEAYRLAFSRFGLFLGVLLVLSGAALLVFPVDMLVHHARIRYLPPVVEHVTQARSQLYGAALLIAGIALAGFSLYRPRRL
jgi:hypothetical protein